MDIEKSIDRINKVLVENKYIDNKNIEVIVKGDIISILYNYFDFDKNQLNLSINTNDNNLFLTLNFKIDRIKNIGILPNSY